MHSMKPPLILAALFLLVGNGDIRGQEVTAKAKRTSAPNAKRSLFQRVFSPDAPAVKRVAGGGAGPQRRLAVAPDMAGEMRDLDGRVYLKARVTQVDPDGVVISYDKGVAKIDFTRLPPEIRQRLGYDEHKAVIYRRQLTSRADDKQRVLKEYEEREIARIQKQLENGASGDELIYGSRGANSNAARAQAAMAKQMEATEAARVAREREPETFWNTELPVATALRTVLMLLKSGSGTGPEGGTGKYGHGCDGGYFHAISHLERPDPTQSN